MATKSLSPKQERIINFVTEFLSDGGYPAIIGDVAVVRQISQRRK
jgi:hypothetical protein